MGILIKPIVSEKQTVLSEKIEGLYGFIVSPNANKAAIKKAIEDLYNVKVKSVNTMNYDGVQKSRNTKSGVVVGRTSAYKKAIVTLEEGHNIDLYSNI